MIALVSNDAIEISALYLLQKEHCLKCTCSYLVVSNGFLPGSPELAQQLFVFAKVCLAADQHDGDTVAEVIHFRIPLMGEKQKC